jgi:hypothetical protein
MGIATQRQLQATMDHTDIHGHRADSAAITSPEGGHI